MGASLGGGSGPIADINVTPLIDVVLVLLVVFMVITPMLKSGIEVDLQPAGSASKSEDISKYIVVAVKKGSAEGAAEGEEPEAVAEWYVETEKADKTTLFPMVESALTERARQKEEEDSTDAIWVLVKADRRLPYEQVREVMNILSENRITTVKLAVAQEGK
jgi:biopolymer transport protein ExbD